ncbi:hypothetical protein GQR58_016206 [Nymphon striatum]|nr:hypothetical protein GQR58_016206 [Nymphon striatum]
MSLATKKGLITRYRNLLEKEIVDCEVISEVPKITGKIEILKDYLSKFELAHENYLIHIESIDETVEIHDNVDKRVEEFLEFMEKITEIIGKLIETRVIQQFWSLENLGVDENVETLKSEDKIAVEKVNKSIKKVNYHYEVAIPWKENIYEFSSVFFGANCSPFLAQYVIQLHAKNNSNKLPLAAETVLKSTYMDDSMDSVKNIDEGIKLYKELIELFKTAGMKPRKWLSNSIELLELIPESDRAKELKLDDSYLPCIKTLGILWDAEADVFKFKFYNENIGFSKRKMLKKIAAIFDPLGFLSPYIIRGKILIQDMWISGIDWDKPLEGKLLKLSMQWLNEMSELNNIYIPRCLSLNEVVQDMTLHAFVDASQAAYGVTVYARCQHVQMLINHFWGRWLKEWIPALNRLKKWHKEYIDLKVDDLVLIICENAPRGTWPVGRVLEIFKGKDNKVRVAKVLVAGKTVVRPITKLCYIDGKKD